MDIREIRYIVEIAKQQSISKAANNLFVTQPALSKMLKKTEADLGLRLFYRDGSTMQPSEACQILVQYGEEIIKAFDQMEAGLYDYKNFKTGTLRLGIPAGMATFDFPGIISRFREQYPHITLNIYESGARSLENMIISGNLDVSISLQPVAPPELNEFPLLQDQFMCAVRTDHPLAQKDYITLEDLVPYNFNTWPDDFAFYQILVEHIRQKKLHITPCITSSNNQFLLRLSQTSQDVCVLPGPVIKRNDTAGLVIKPFRPAIYWDLCIVFKKNAPMMDSLRYLILCMQEEIGAEHEE
ncbi:MAG: LysR family transcriptional regulator [Lachnospiraceae bacterium]|jgi:DNA-binding transcriptional LysR family regulator